MEIRFSRQAMLSNLPRVSAGQCLRLLLVRREGSPQWPQEVWRDIETQRVPVPLKSVCVVIQLCLMLCDPSLLEHKWPGSSLHGVFQARILEWVGFPTPRDLPAPGIEPVSLVSPALVGSSLPLCLLGSSPGYLLILLLTFSGNWNSLSSNVL